MTTAKKWAVAVSALVLIGGAAYLIASRNEGREALQAAVPAPDFTYPDLAGHPTALSSYRGKVVLLDFWATWCEPCQAEIPDLKKLYSDYRDKGFVVVGVAMDSMGREIVEPFVKANDVDYPILVSKGEPPSGYPIIGFPTAFLIDRKGMVAQRYVGEMGYEDFAKDVKDALAR